MASTDVKTGFVNAGKARLYYEIAGSGMPLVLIHAGVADSRQWNNELEHFAKDHLVVRYDMRGYGKSQPVDEKFSHMKDLSAMLDTLAIDEPVVLMGCSMGGGLAMDFALTYPSRVKALIMVCSAPSGLELDVPTPPKFSEAEKVYEAKDWDQLAEIETQIWFDGMGRNKEDVNPKMRQLAYEMNRIALGNEAIGLGERLPDTDTPAKDRLADLKLPVQIIVGANDIPYMLAAADYMMETLPNSQKAVIENAAHLANMDQPEKFQEIVTSFLKDLHAAGKS